MLGNEKTSGFVIGVAVSAATAGLMFGYDIGVINSALVFLRSAFTLGPVATEMVTTALFWGCAAGAAIAGWASDRFGRRVVLLAAGVLFCLGDGTAAMAASFWQLLAARLIAGVAVGSALVVAPVYIAEISPARSRGRLVTVNQLAVVSGILAGFLCNFELATLAHDNWRVMFASGAVPALALCLSLVWIPESPRWLIQHGDSERAIAILQRANAGADDAQVAFAEIRTTLREETGTYKELFGAALRKPLGLAVLLAIIQQVTGVNTVMYYGAILFAEHTGATATEALAMNVMVGLVNLLFTILGLVLIDKLGRRPLLLLATGGMALCLIAFAAMLHIWAGHPLLLLVPVLGYVACFAFGLGTGVWVCLAELFPNRVRGRAMSIATMALWISVSAVAASFLTLIRAFSVATVFLGYAGLCIASFVYIFIALPETRNSTLEEIEKIWTA